MNGRVMRLGVRPSGVTSNLADWIARSTAPGVTFASDFSGANDFTLASVNGGTGRVWAPSMNSTQLAQVVKDTTDGLTNGCCLRIDKPANENDFANGAGQEWMFPLNSAWTTNAESFGLGVPFWIQFRFKIPASRLILSTITSGGQAGWKWFLAAQYSPTSTASQSFAHSLAQIVLQDTNQFGIPQAYYSDVAGNSQPFVETSAGGVYYTPQNSIDRGSGTHDVRYCEVPSPFTAASPGCEFWPAGEWVTNMVRIKPVTYSGTGATGNEFDFYYARAGVYTWTHMMSFRNFELGDPNSNGGGFTGINGGHFSTFETGRVSGQDTHQKFDQVIVSTSEIAIPLDSGTP